LISETHIDALLARLADGDRAAFTPVFQQLWQPVFRLCLSMLKSEADASDATQQAMEKILQRASDYDGKRSAVTWALAIAGWECRTILRRRERRREVSDDLTSAAPPASAGAEEELVHRDLVEAAVHALGDLSSTDRETLIATFSDEASPATGATLRKRRERAMGRLRIAFRRLYGLD
jgi:RNA polymerase sigma-70 factor (ECF subfamily)